MLPNERYFRAGVQTSLKGTTDNQALFFFLQQAAFFGPWIPSERNEYQIIWKTSVAQLPGKKQQFRVIRMLEAIRG